MREPSWRKFEISGLGFGIFWISLNGVYAAFCKLSNKMGQNVKISVTSSQSCGNLAFCYSLTMQNVQIFANVANIQVPFFWRETRDWCNTRISS
jgi:hypothetical protein